MLTILHIDGAEVHPVAPDDLDAALAGPGFVWLDFESPSGDDVELLYSASLALHPLVIEDMVEDRHLPKVDVYGDQMMLTVHALDLDQAAVELTTLELDVTVKSNVLITYHDRPIRSVSAVRQRLQREGGADATHPVRLLWRMLDVMNDVFVPFVDLIERRLDVVEADILSEPTEETRREIYELQRDVIQLRRAVVPQAEVLRRLGRDGPDLLTEHDRELIRDVYDHLYRIAEMSDSYRQLLDNAMTNYRSSLDDDLNEMLTVLTLFSALVLPLTLLAGIYGMNFEHMPELGQRWAYPAFWALGIVIVIGELIWFRRRGWIGGRAERDAQQRRAELSQVLEIPVLGEVLRIPAYGARAVLNTGKAIVGLPVGIARRVLGSDDLPYADEDDAGA